MKIISSFFFRVMLFLALLVHPKTGQAQSCTASFVYSVGSGGNVTFTSTSINSQTPTIYSWNFGNGSPVQTGSNLAQAAALYSVNGSYVVTLTITSTNSLCVSTSSVIINVGTNFPNCSVSVNYTPASSASTCDGVATVSNVFGLCGVLTYTWSNSTTGPTASGLCPGVYSVMIAGSTGSFCCPSIMGIVSVSATPCALNANFSHAQYSNGGVSFTNTSTGTVSGVSYLWNFGDGSPSSNLSSPTHTYVSNGNYLAVLSASNNSGCTDSTGIVVTVNSYSPCNASFIYSLNGNGNVTFTSTSTGANSLTSYTWNFGNGITYTNTGTAGITASQTYTASGTYSVTLNFTNSNCSSSITQLVTVNLNPCNLNADFTYTTGPNTGYFTSISTGTLAGTTYTWNYGDASGGSGVTSTHVYTNPGTYIVGLTANNHFTPACISTKTMAVVINSICSLSANFTHTVNSGGLVNFVNTSTLTGSGMSCYWNFGDGVSSLACNPSHAYGNAGAYLVWLFVSDSSSNCQDSIAQSINITGVPCVANSNFTLVPTATPQFWNAIPSYPWNVTAATWSWGDGASSNTLYTSHLYSVSAMYTICLSVTVSCGASSTSCMSYSVYRSAETNTNAIININVIPPEIQNGLPELNDNLAYTVYPNPNDGEFNLSLSGLSQEKIKITVFNLIGGIIYTDEDRITEENVVKTISLKNIAGGIYFIRVNAGSKMFTQKIVISN